MDRARLDEDDADGLVGGWSGRPAASDQGRHLGRLVAMGSAHPRRAPRDPHHPKGPFRARPFVRRGSTAAIRKPKTPDTRKRPKELMGTSVRRVLRLRTNPQSLVAAWFLARLPCGRRTWFQGPSRGSLLEPVWRFNLPLRARRNVRWGPWSPQRACPRTCSQVPESYPRTWPRCGRSVDTLIREVWNGSSHRTPRRRAGRMGNATRRFQPPLAERPLPTDPATQGLPQRGLARAPTPRGSHGHPDRHAPAGRHPGPAEPARGRRRRAGGDDPVHARGRRDRRRRLHGHRRHGTRPRDAPLDVDGRRPAPPADLAGPARRRARPTGPSRSPCR